MLSPEEVSILTTTASVSLAHTLLPNHWLSFSLVGRAQHWTLSRTLTITAIGGLGHVTTTYSLGLLLSYLGSTIIPTESYEKLGPWLLVFIGFMYLMLHVRGVRHSHSHGVESCESQKTATFSEQTAAALMVIALPTLSPCAAIIPIFLMTDIHKTSLSFYVSLFFLLLATTIAVMTIMVWLSFAGAQKLSFKSLDKYEKLIIGGLLFALGVVAMFLEHDHHHHIEGGENHDHFHGIGFANHDHDHEGMEHHDGDDDDDDGDDGDEHHGVARLALRYLMGV
eukprot:TRINITY_DN4355_c0_g1::TRINITY_DN4355_c0_g1_i1::g.21227::m.21227 TRINITY_DN4355_c0_g1::TRINITY_DN4355_c0_g1_i1::g.21227  ORF type:complete len:281 (+),score=39.00,DsbD_2/PF13386.1/0.019,DUF3671/PF12420.3/3.7,DUF3671/PF12420.3/2.1e+02 TRINITY_DN4355_c0_g1_i1:69-911(+)